MSWEALRVEQSNGTATLTLNRPQALNALNPQLVDELNRAIAQLREAENIRAVVLTGSGRAFCGGGDVKMVRSWTHSGQMQDWVEYSSRTLLELLHLPKPTIAAVNGLAAGAGCNLALACDWVVASEEARFSQIFVQLGLVPDMGGTYFLSRLVGVARAKRLVFTGEMIDARTATDWGLITEVVPKEKFSERVREVAAQLAHAPTRALTLAKRLMHRALSLPLEAALEAEAEAEATLFSTEDYREGLTALAEKRKPLFRGC